MTATCAVGLYRGASFRREKCGKPAKDEKVAGGRSWPVCGVHLRTSNPFVEVEPGRYRSMRDLNA